ncbi:MAG TPA: pitrilysin family protein [Dehalococcoidia bacterium]|nr:pitrilysin family protein [Dehalococcoidia bacterium]
MASSRSSSAGASGDAGISWEVSTLANGLRVVTTPIPTAQSASVNVFVGVGSRAEERRVNGVSHYMEHMLFKGTPERPNAIIIASAIEGAGGVLNAYTTKDLTCYWNQVPYDMLGVAMEVVADMVQHSLLEEVEIERERTVVQQEIRRSHDQPGSWVGELLSKVVYGDQPIGWSIAGTIDTVQGIQRPDMVRHLSEWYVPTNIVLSVSGNVSHDEVVERAARLWENGSAPAVPRVAPAAPEMPAERILCEERDIAQANIAIGMRSLARQDPDRFALTILNNILGRGMSSRLFREVRERRGLAYSVGASTSRYLDTGTFSISAGVSPENAVEAVQVIMGEVAKLVAEPVGEEELTKARDYAVGSFRLGLESTMALAQRAGESLLMLGMIEKIEDVVTGLKSVTAADVQRVARRVFRADNLALAAVGHGLNVEGLQAALTL